MDILLDPAIWAGLLTLVVLEIVLGIDNLVFIAILAKKLPPAQQDRALYTGLGLALLMRLGLLSIMSWLISLTTPLFEVLGRPISARDLILIAGGLFLIFKATLELHERLESHSAAEVEKRTSAGFWVVITQILLVDAVFSIDSIITAVGMVDELAVMMAAVVVAMIVMMAASRPLTSFVNRHPTVIVLCLAFLLMIGFSLVAEGFGLHIPKGYLYAAIAFSVLIEAFNQTASRRTNQRLAKMPFRARTTLAIVKLMSPQRSEPRTEAEALAPQSEVFSLDEQRMVEGVLTLAERSIRTVMTPRSEIGWLNLRKPIDEIISDARSLSHSIFPVCNGSLDHIVGLVKAKELINGPKDVESIRRLAAARQPLTVPETISVIRLVRDVKRTRASVVIVADEFGVVQGLATSHDILEAIAGDFPDEGDRDMVKKIEGGWLADGTADLMLIEQTLGIDGLMEEDADYVTVAGLLLERFGRLPEAGESIVVSGWRFEAAAVVRNRIASVKITPASS